MKNKVQIVWHPNPCCITVHNMADLTKARIESKILGITGVTKVGEIRKYQMDIEVGAAFDRGALSDDITSVLMRLEPEQRNKV